MNRTYKYNPNIHHRRSIRLKGYDYSKAGLYFITLCCQGRECLFGGLIDGKMILNEAGNMITAEWLALPGRFPNIQLHEKIVMPNHFHGILEIAMRSVEACLVEAPYSKTMDTSFENGQQLIEGQPQGIAPTNKTKTIGDIMAAFKSKTTVEYIRGINSLGWRPFKGKLWQRNYWEHIIRDEGSYFRIAEYIIYNPTKWVEDKLNPAIQEKFSR